MKTSLTVSEHNLLVLCELLHMPAYKLKAEMPFSEYQDWMIYLEAQRGGGKSTYKDDSDALIDLVKGF